MIKVESRNVCKRKRGYGQKRKSVDDTARCHCEQRERPSVYVVKNQVAQLIKIQTGRNYNSELEVVSGLNEGEKIVINGQINLTNGSKVSVIN